MKPFTYLLTLLVITLLLPGCNRNQVFKEYHKFSNNTWRRIGEDITFKVEIKDISKRYDITIPIRHASFYPHAFIELGFNIYSPSGQESYSVKKVYLKDIDGSWKGKGMGDIWDFDYHIFKEYAFVEPGNFTFEIQNLTGNNMFLPGIMEIGLIIKKSK